MFLRKKCKQQLNTIQHYTKELTDCHTKILKLNEAKVIRAEIGGKYQKKKITKKFKAIERKLKRRGGEGQNGQVAGNAGTHISTGGHACGVKIRQM